MRVALVHDSLTGLRGGEKCLQAFLQIYPEQLFHWRGHFLRIADLFSGFLFVPVIGKWCFDLPQLYLCDSYLPYLVQKVSVYYRSINRK